MIIALAGNPNVGKSTLFNSLTGLKQHTGNWTGKTVENAIGRVKKDGKQHTIIDLPGTYSLLSCSKEEECARDYICFNKYDVVAVVVDATSLERNLNLLLQIMEITSKVALVVNLMDEAERKGINIDIDKLSQILGIAVVGISARDKRQSLKVIKACEQAINQDNIIRVRYDDCIEQALDCINEDVKRLSEDRIDSRFTSLKLLSNEGDILNSINRFINADFFCDKEFSDNYLKAKEVLGEEFSQLTEQTVYCIVKRAEDIADKVVSFSNKTERDRKIDKILTSRVFGFPIMLALLALVFLITIRLANYPGILLTNLFSFIENKLNIFFYFINMPTFIHAPLMDGIYRTTAWVISVMLPPMAIFFPLFTFLEDLGYLPRVAFNLDRPFLRCGANGKQCLTMCMGFGCNAVGVTGTKIIDSKRERLLAILTNSFVPCNGRFPTLIAISGFLLSGLIIGTFFVSLLSSLIITFFIILGIFATFLVCGLLSKTILRGVSSSFSLELPPFRKPRIGQILIRSLLDRTVFVLLRAIVVAAPSGLIIWILANIDINSVSILNHVINFLSPLGRLMGLDGSILSAFILGFPANEIVIPLAVLAYTNGGSLTEVSNLNSLYFLLRGNGWTIITAINVLIFTIFHFPCATTVLTIKKQTNSVKWTLLAMLLPTVIGVILCIISNGLYRLILLCI